MYIEINGINIWYENTGSGKPIILLHGNGEDNSIFNVLTGQLSDKFNVFAPDTRSHGKSGKVKKLHYSDAAEDIKIFIEKLGLVKPILYGFSDGGITGLLLSIKYPGILSKLIISGANANPDGINNMYKFLIKLSYFFTRSDKLRLMLNEPDIKKEELNSIKVPALILAGEKDFTKEENTQFIAKNIPNSRLIILKGETHSSYVVNSPKLFDIINPFICMP